MGVGLDSRTGPPAVREARARLPATLDGFVAAFGYQSCEEPVDVFLFLVLAADIFSLEFPFDVRTVRDTVVITERTAGGDNDETTDILRRLKTIESDCYHETGPTARVVECDAAVLDRVIGGPLGWNVLDEEHRYFWKVPCLPPHNYAMTGNAILTGLCKVFSVAREARSVDLAQAVGRQRGVRRTVPGEVVEGIAVRSGLFDVNDGNVRKKTGQAWFCIRQRDLDLLRVCAQQGRVVSSRARAHSRISRSSV